jgi:hypothetical protein
MARSEFLDAHAVREMIKQRIANSVDTCIGRAHHKDSWAGWIIKIFAFVFELPVNPSPFPAWIYQLGNQPCEREASLLDPLFVARFTALREPEFKTSDWEQPPCRRQPLTRSSEAWTM